MNKQELLKDYKKQEDKLCLSQVLDKIETLKNTLGDNYKNIISNNMNILKYLV